MRIVEHIYNKTFGKKRIKTIRRNRKLLGQIITNQSNLYVIRKKWK